MPTAAARILQQEIDFFEKQRLDLFARAPGKYALVKGSELLGIFDSELEAVRAGYRQLGNEAFLVKHIVEADVVLTLATLFAPWPRCAPAAPSLLPPRECYAMRRVHARV